jgi:hypothetical protein
MIDKLIQMLGEEKDKIAADLVAEEKEMKEYFQFCKDEQSEKGYTIKTATRKIDDTTALIDNNNAEIESLEADLTELGAEQKERADQKDKAEELRAQQHKDFLKREDEQSILVSELEAMLKELKHQIATMTTPPPVLLQEDGALDGPVRSAEEVSELADEIDDGSQGGGGFTSFAQLKSTQETEHLSEAQMSAAIKKMQRLLNAMSVDPLMNKDGRKLAMIQETEFSEAIPKSQSVDVVQGLVEKAEKALQAEREAETNQAQAHALAMQALKDEMMLADDKIADAKKDKAKLSEEAAKAGEEKATASESKAADEKFLARLKAECKGTSDAWANRQTEAKAEMEAINQAKEILASRVKVFNQESVSFLQFSSTKMIDLSAQDKLEQAKVRQTLMNHFRKLGNKLHSVSMLNLISVANAAPMDKVKNLIKGLIEKLEKEAAEAADTHAFCEEEKKKNADATEKTQATLDKLGARLDKASAKSAELNERVTELSDEIVAIDEAVTEATKIRDEEKATFTKSNADFKEAADAVSDAIDVLKDFYGGGGAFIQISAVTAHKDDPWKRMFGHSLRAAEDQPEEVVGVDPSEAGDGIGAVAIPKMGGASAAKGGIIFGMMETMAGEFSKTVAELGATEDKAQKEYDEMIQDNKVSKVSKEMEIKGSKSELSMLEVRIGESEEDQKLATKEMAAINAYILKLKPTCEGRVVSFAERQAKREAEIAGCKEALQILDDTTAQIGLVQVSVTRHLRKH